MKRRNYLFYGKTESVFRMSARLQFRGAKHSICRNWKSWVADNCKAVVDIFCKLRNKWNTYSHDIDKMIFLLITVLHDNEETGEGGGGGGGG